MSTPGTISKEDVEIAKANLNAEVDRVEAELTELKRRRDNLDNAWELLRTSVSPRPIVGPTVVRKATPNEDETKVIMALRQIGRFSTSRDIAPVAKLDVNRIRRVTPKMRHSGMLVSHPLAEASSKYHFPLGLPDFVNADGTVKPGHEYEHVEKLRS